MTGEISARALREKLQYNEGLRRDTYNRVLSHAKHYYGLRHRRLRTEPLRHAEGRAVLEIGSERWVPWLERAAIRPASLECINISEVELQKGIDEVGARTIRPHFSIMDANNLEFADASFDVVFGGGILHHLDFFRALDGVRRVLKPGGIMVFHEPLAVNPVGKLVRVLTPAARTTDEQPLGLRELAAIRQRFDSQFHYEQLLSVPFSVLSRLLFKRPDNPLMHAAYLLDRALDRLLPPIRPLYRYVLIVGRKAARNTPSMSKQQPSWNHRLDRAK